MKGPELICLLVAFGLSVWSWTGGPYTDPPRPFDWERDR